MKNFESARTVLGLGIYELAGVSLRPFSKLDFGALHEILSASDEMTWERVSATQSYTRRLLEFRLKHYEEWGFGVLAVEHAATGRLLGQAGLQALDPDGERIEVVIFLRSDALGQGLGKGLMVAILDRCKDSGLSELYATVRPENARARSLVDAVGFSYIGDMNHFGMSCALWGLRLENQTTAEGA
jgi:RimJ/RimL family protein N-acetyltransferase